MGFFSRLFGREPKTEKTPEQQQAESELWNLCATLQGILDQNAPKGLSKGFQEKNLIKIIIQQYVKALATDPSVKQSHVFKQIVDNKTNLLDYVFRLLNEVYERALIQVLIKFGTKQGINTHEDLVRDTGFEPRKSSGTRGELFYNFHIRPITTNPQEARNLCKKVEAALGTVESGTTIDIAELSEQTPSLTMIRVFVHDSFFSEARRQKLLNKALS